MYFWLLLQIYPRTKDGFVVQGHIWLSAGVVNPVVRISTIFYIKRSFTVIKRSLKVHF